MQAHSNVSLFAPNSHTKWIKIISSRSDTLFFSSACAIVGMLALVLRSFLDYSFALLFLSSFHFCASSTKEPTEKNIKKRSTQTIVTDCPAIAGYLMALCCYRLFSPKANRVWAKIPLRVTVIMASHFIDVFGISLRMRIIYYIWFCANLTMMMTASRSMRRVIDRVKNSVYEQVSQASRLIRSTLCHVIMVND